MGNYQVITEIIIIITMYLSHTNRCGHKSRVTNTRHNSRAGVFHSHENNGGKVSIPLIRSPLTPIH